MPKQRSLTITLLVFLCLPALACAQALTSPTPISHKRPFNGCSVATKYDGAVATINLYWRLGYYFSPNFKPHGYSDVDPRYDLTISLTKKLLPFSAVNDKFKGHEALSKAVFRAIAICLIDSAELPRPVKPESLAIIPLYHQDDSEAAFTETLSRNELAQILAIIIDICGLPQEREIELPPDVNDETPFYKEIKSCFAAHIFDIPTLPKREKSDGIFSLKEELDILEQVTNETLARTNALTYLLPFKRRWRRRIRKQLCVLKTRLERIEPLLTKVGRKLLSTSSKSPDTPFRSVRANKERFCAISDKAVELRKKLRRY